MTVNELRAIIDFMYSGVLRVAKRRIRTMLNAARALGVAKLVEVLSVCSIQHLLHPNLWSRS